MPLFLSEEQQTELMFLHKQERLRRCADRIKAILLLNNGWSYEQIAKVLFLDDQTIRNYEYQFKNFGIEKLISDNYLGGQNKLSVTEEEELKNYVSNNTFSSAKEISSYIKEKFNVEFTPQGLVHTLHRIGFVYKKTKLVPGKADPEKQKAFIEQYKQLKEKIEPEDKILFMDGTHPHHNPMPAYCWILKGETKEIPSNTGRKRINLNGAIDIYNLDVTIREDESINAQSTIELFKEIEKKYTISENIYVIADNAMYYRSKMVQEYLETSRIKIVFLPPYSPNLNLIERLWRFFHKETLDNIYYDTYAKFKIACMNFFENIDQYKSQLRSLLTENFQIIGGSISKT